MDQDMAEESVTKNTQAIYSIRVKGILTEEWSDWFEGLDVTPEADGETIITGKIQDQAVLYGLLKKIRDLGLPLISVNRWASYKKSNNIQGEENEK
jgi:hypothetical protein